jgi:hypothetical protein
MEAGQVYVRDIQGLAKNTDMNINLHIHWVPGHMNIYGNGKVDEAAKGGAKLQSSTQGVVTSLSSLRIRIKGGSLLEWNQQWISAKNKGRSYSKGLFRKTDWRVQANHFVVGGWRSQPY